MFLFKAQWQSDQLFAFSSFNSIWLKLGKKVSALFVLCVMNDLMLEWQMTLYLEIIADSKAINTHLNLSQQSTEDQNRMKHM